MKGLGSYLLPSHNVSATASPQQQQQQKVESPATTKTKKSRGGGGNTTNNIAAEVGVNVGSTATATTSPANNNKTKNSGKKNTITTTPSKRSGQQQQQPIPLASSPLFQATSSLWPQQQQMQQQFQQQMQPPPFQLYHNNQLEEQQRQQQHRMMTMMSMMNAGGATQQQQNLVQNGYDANVVSNGTLPYFHPTPATTMSPYYAGTTTTAGNDYDPTVDPFDYICGGGGGDDENNGVVVPFQSQQSPTPPQVGPPVSSSGNNNNDDSKTMKKTKGTTTGGGGTKLSRKNSSTHTGGAGSIELSSLVTSVESYFSGIRIPSTFLLGITFLLLMFGTQSSDDNNNNDPIQRSLQILSIVCLGCTFVFSLVVVVVSTCALIKHLTGNFNNLYMTQQQSQNQHYYQNGYDLLCREFYYEFILTRWCLIMSMFTFLWSISAKVLYECQLFNKYDGYRNSDGYWTKNNPTTSGNTCLGIAIVLLTVAITFHLMSYVNSTLIGWRNFVHMTMDLCWLLLHRVTRRRGQHYSMMESLSVVMWIIGLVLLTYGLIMSNT